MNLKNLINMFLFYLAVFLLVDYFINNEEFDNQNKTVAAQSQVLQNNKLLDLPVPYDNKYEKNNNSNFNSNVLDVSKYYKINDIKETTHNIDEPLTQSSYIQPSNDDEYIEYKDELPMNGGLFGDITGFDENDNEFAPFY